MKWDALGVTGRKKFISLTLVLVGLFLVLNPILNSELVDFVVEEALIGGLIILFPSLYVFYRSGLDLGYVLMVTAIPLCIAHSLVELVGMLQMASDFNKAFTDMPRILSTIFTGALLSSIGYFTKANAPVHHKPFTNIDLLICIAFLFACFSWLMHQATGLGAFIDLPSMQFLLGFLLFAFAGSLINNKKLSVWLGDGSIAAMLFGIITLAIFYYSTVYDPKAMGPLLVVGLISSLYGCLMLYISFLFGIKENSLQEMNLATKNWHVIEAFAFLVFLVYGPPTLFEVMGG